MRSIVEPASILPPTTRSRDHRMGGGPYERFNKRISWLPRDSLGGLNFVLDPPQFAVSWSRGEVILFRGHQEIFTVRHFVVIKRFSWWIKFLFWTPPPNSRSRDLVVKWKDFVVTKRFSWWMKINFDPPPSIKSLEFSWWNIYCKSLKVNCSAC